MIRYTQMNNCPTSDSSSTPMSKFLPAYPEDALDKIEASGRSSNTVLERS